jgi:hypothetical protein
MHFLQVYKKLNDKERGEKGMSIKIEISDEMKRDVIGAIYLEKGRAFVEDVMVEFDRRRIVNVERVERVEKLEKVEKAEKVERVEKVESIIEKRREKYERIELSDELRCKWATCRGNRCTFYVVENGLCQRHIEIKKRALKEKR